MFYFTDMNGIPFPLTLIMFTKRQSGANALLVVVSIDFVHSSPLST